MPLNGKDRARQRRDHALPDKRTKFYSEAERLACFRPSRPKEVGWRRHLRELA